MDAQTYPSILKVSHSVGGAVARLLLLLQKYATVSRTMGPSMRNDPKFKGLFTVIFIDEKLFYLTRKF
jgi:hypothetical protein